MSRPLPNRRGIPERQRKSETTSIPAPTKGLNSKDAIANMDPMFALKLDNCFCTPTTVDTRNGVLSWATGISGIVETIAGYSGGATQALFAADDDGNIYDISSSGPVGAADVSGLQSGQFQDINFSTPGGDFMYLVNGLDDPLLYNGSIFTPINDISTPAITGVTTSDFIHVNAFKSRIWFTQKNTLSMWYLPINSIAGAATEFPLGSIFLRGGYIMAMMTWTIDNTQGIDDYAVFITSEGEVAIYKGFDPDFASTFTLVGLFRMGRPIGRRCFTKMGSDNVVICADGVVTLSKELTTDRNLSSALSYNIQNLITGDVAAFPNNFGWQPVYYPIGNKLIVNVPAVEGSVSYQYVMNTITGAWSTWNKENMGYVANCWEVFQDVVYVGSDGAVYQSDTGQNDLGDAIISDIKPAFSYFEDLGQEKYFTMVRPIFNSNGTVTPTFALCLDYNDISPATPSLNTGGGSPWNTSPWNISPWQASNVITKDWRTVGGIGYAASLRMATNLKNVGASLQSIDYCYEKGGVL